MVAGVASCTGGDTRDPSASEPPAPLERQQISDLEVRVADIERAQDELAAGMATAGDRIEEFFLRLREWLARKGQAAGSQDSGAVGPPWAWLGCLVVALAAGWAIGRSRQQLAPSLDPPPLDDHAPVDKDQAVTALPSAHTSNGHPPAVTAKISRLPGTAAVSVELELVSADPQSARRQLDGWLGRDPRVLDLPAPEFDVAVDRLRVQFHLIARPTERRHIPPRE